MPVLFLTPLWTSRKCTDQEPVIQFLKTKLPAGLHD